MMAFVTPGSISTKHQQRGNVLTVIVEHLFAPSEDLPSAFCNNQISTLYTSCKCEPLRSCIRSLKKSFHWCAQFFVSAFFLLAQNFSNIRVAYTDSFHVPIP